MLFNQRAIEIILKSYGFSSQAPREFQQFHINYYPHQTLTQNLLLEESINYFQTHYPRLKARRICFLIQDENKKSYAILIQLCDYNTEIAEKLNEKLISLNTISLRTLIFQYPEVVKQFKKLYRNVTCMGLSTHNKNSSLTAYLWPACIKSAYVNPQLHFQCLKDDPINNSLSFIEMIQQFLLVGSIAIPMDSQGIYLRQTQHYAEVLVNCVQDIMLQDAILYQQIIDSLFVLFKYTVLSSLRQQLEFKGASLEKMEMIKARDQINKSYVYSQIFSNSHIKDYFQCLTVDALVKLLICPNAQSKRHYLEQLRHQQLQALLEWEANVANGIRDCKKDWKIYLTWLGKKTVNNFYYHSFIGLSAELVSWLAHQLMKGVSKIFFFKKSEELRNSSRWDENLILKTLGGGLGVLFTWWNGSYSFLRLFITNYFSLQLSQYFSRNQRDDTNACIAFPKRNIFDENSFIIAISAFIAVGESIIFKDYQFAIGALSGMISSYAAVSIAKQLFSHGDILQNQAVDEQQRFNLFFISLIGTAIGQWLMRYGYSVFENRQKCQAAAQAFGEFSHPSVKAWTMQCRKEDQTFNFWFNKQQETIPLSWTTHDDKFYETECHLLTTQDGSHWMVCEQPILSETLRLNR